MGSSVSKIVKKVTKPIKKIASSPIGQIAMAAYLGPAAASSGFLSGMNPIVRNAILNAATQKLTTGEVDLKSAIASGAISGGIGKTGILSGIQNEALRNAVTTGLSNAGTSLVTGQKIDPRQVLLSSALSGGITQLQQSGKLPYYQQVQEKLGFQPSDTTGTDQIVDPTQDFSGTQLGEQTQTPTFRESMADLNLQRGFTEPSELTPSVSPKSVGEIYSGAFAGEEYDMPGGAVGIEPITGKMGQTTGIRFTDPDTGATSITKGNFADIPITGEGGRIDRFQQAVKDFSGNKTVGGALNILKEISGAAIDRPLLSITALTSIVSAASIPQQPDESDEAYQQRLNQVEQYVRRYGANLNLPQSQINRILSNVRAESAGDVSYDFANGGRVMRNMGGPGNFSLGDLTRFIDVNPRDGIDDRDPMNGMGMRTMAMGGGIMGIPVRDNGMGIQELDYRQEGGFVPVGVKEKADDVPAMLSKNEFVMTADAVKGADPEGEGNVERGAQAMYDTMKRLESKIA